MARLNSFIGRCARVAIASLGLALIGASLRSTAAQASSAPRLGLSSFSQLPTPLPYPYDPSADADQALAQARARAVAGHKLLLIDLGGDWCPDCRILAATMALPSLRAYLDAHYEMVSVDVGRFDRNLQIPAHYGITKRLEGVPSVLIIDPQTDRLLDAGHVFALSDARSMSPQALADWLAQWIKP